KVMPPVTDAVGLVDGKGMDAGVLQEAIEVGVDEAFRRREDEADASLSDVHLVGEAFSAGEGRVDLDGGDADALEGIDLVLHEGDQRGNHDGGAAAVDGRRL